MSQTSSFELHGILVREEGLGSASNFSFNSNPKSQEFERLGI